MLDTNNHPDVAASVEVLEATGTTTAVAIVLHGGKADSFVPDDLGQLAAVRMRPFASILHRRGRAHGLAVWTVQYRFRGWNGANRSPVADAQWALDEVRRRHGDVPVVLVGHSLGGRTALAAGGDPSVVGVCALAPWTESNDRVAQLAGKSLIIAHSSMDVVTSPRGSRDFARRAAQVAARVGYINVVGDTHAMLFRWRTWHRIAAEFTLGVLEIRPMSRRITEALARGV